MFLTSRRSRQKENGNSEAEKHVTIIGAGRVAAPLVEYLHRDRNIAITVVCEQQNLGDELAQKYPGIQSTYLNVLDNEDALLELLSKSNLAVSILPANLHPIVAKACIRTNTHMVTASYLSETVKELHDEATNAGITILNEIGLDPGIDHLLALECIHVILIILIIKVKFSNNTIYRKLMLLVEE